MTFKGILFCLFLYVCLVWVGAAYFFSGPKITEFGLLWTGAGILTVLGFILLSRVWSLIRRLKATSAARPKRAPAPVESMNETEAAVRALLAEANANLRKSAAFGSSQSDPLSALPLYLLVGPPGTGKTTTFVNSGIEPQLLAGQAGSASGHLPTRLCNLWLASNALFVEVGGAVFSDLNRWGQLLRAFQVNEKLPSWKALWVQSPSVKGFDLQAVIAFCEVKEFTGASNVQARDRLDRLSSDWQDRLSSIAEIFRLAAPVHVLVTKCDSLPFFNDYFRRMPEAETGQVLGCALEPVAGALPSANSAEDDSKRLTKAFTGLYRALSERRILHLAHEPDRSRRAGVYEFPRELKRIRPAVIQFLTGLFRPRSLSVNCELRGFYFSGTGERQLLQASGDSGAQWSENSVEQEATVLFRGDATQIFRPNDSRAVKSVALPGLTRRWMFVSELFQTVVVATRPVRRMILTDTSLERRRQFTCAAVCAVCLVLCAGFLTSWVGNAALLRDLDHFTEPQIRGALSSLAELQSLDELRAHVNLLTRYEHDGAPFHLGWGLYSGNRIVGAAQARYFRRFAALLLEPADKVMLGRLQDLPSVPGPNDPYSPAFQTLKTHLMISSGACQPDPPFVAEHLKSLLPALAPSGSDSQWQLLAAQQIDFYASQLRYGNPCRISEYIATRDHARQYLAQIQGVDRMYANVLSAAERAVPKALNLSEISPNYSDVLTGPSELKGVFSKEGWSFVEKMSRQSIASSSSDACVLGDTSSFGAGTRRDAETAHAIQQLYLRDYVEAWRAYVSSFSVKRYSSSADAARKLDILSDHKSPLLALFALTSNQTGFPKPVADPALIERVAPAIQKWIPFPKAKASSQPAAVAPPVSGVDTIRRTFQPIHAVVPPDAETWVTDKNSAYVEALAQLSHSMGEIARSGATPDQAVYQAASQNYEKAMDAARQIARTFEPLGVGGLDMTAERLLEAPIRQTQSFIVSDPLGAEAAKINGALRPVCSRLHDTLRKFPFSPGGPDASVDEVSALFAPGRGLVWKFQTESLGDFVVKEAGSWKAKDPSKKPQVTQEMLSLLNRAQGLTDALYPNGSSQPQFTYTLRPKLDASYRDAVLELEVDGRVYAWTSSIQKQFTWSAVSDPGNSGVIGRVKTGALSFPFVSRGGSWAIFRIMDDAEPRPIGAKLVEWKNMRGGDGRLEEIQPAPVRLEIVEFPGGADLFNPKFFESLQCPGKAVQ